MNTTILLGRLTRDPEEKFTPAGDAVSIFSIAVDRAGDKQDDDTYAAGFFECSAFGKTAELINQHFHKGKQIVVRGSLQHHRWENNDGDKRSKVQIRVQEFSFTGSKDDGARVGDDDPNPFAPAGTPRSTATDDFDAPAIDNDIPF